MLLLAGEHGEQEYEDDSDPNPTSCAFVHELVLLRP
jgi:hypothetical protein